MFVTSIVEEDWCGTSSNEYVTNCVDLQSVLEAVRRLDGKSKTLVILRGPDEASLTVGGGGELGHYIVYADVSGSFHTLVSDTPDEAGALSIVAGGQEGHYPTRHCVKFDQVLEACSIFAQTGQLSDSVTWDVS